VWGIKKRRPVWKRRGLAILLVLAFVGPILFLASFVDSLTANLLTWLPAPVTQVVDATGLVMAILLDIALFMLIYMVLPHAGSSWRVILPGAIGAGLLWEVAKKTFLFFVSTYVSISNLIYGSLAAIIAVMTWSYLSGVIFLFGAYLSASYSRRRQKRQEATGQTG
jgi:membrane protein